MRLSLLSMLVCASALSALPVSAVEVKVVPPSPIFAYQTNASRDYHDLVIHTIAVAAAEGETFTVEGVKIELLAGGKALLTKNIYVERMVEETRGIAGMAEQGLRSFLDAQILSPGGLAGLFDRKLMNTARVPTLQANEALLTTRHHFSVDAVPDRARITVLGLDSRGNRRSLHTDVPVARHRSPIKYIMPVRGAWLMHGIPGIRSHHRLNPPTEFAVDFFKVDDHGRISSGNVLDAATYYGFGAEVRAAAAGEVVFVIADEKQDRAALTRRKGESPQEAGRRIGRHNMQRYATDFRRAAGGNIVTIRHDNSGVVEYSSYGHLKTGSVHVKVGDRVRQGQIIGEVGDTGDSAAAHLHFQVNAGADPFFSKSLPVTFANMNFVGMGLDPGRFVTSE